VYDVNQNISIQKPKTVEQDMLENAINEFETVINQYNITS
jgi:hypothetical protein